jgi:dolichyl-phosphate-mannose--protein O-mannosyl transferase
MYTFYWVSNKTLDNNLYNKMKYVVITIFLIVLILSFYFYRRDLCGVSFTNKKDSHEFLMLLHLWRFKTPILKLNLIKYSILL